MCRKIICMSLLALFCWVLPATCGAAEPSYSITETELTKLQSNLEQLSKNYRILLMDSNTSSKELIEVLQQLTELKQQLNQCKAELTTTQQSLNKAQASLETANELFKEYVKEEDKEKQRLKSERTLGYIVAIVALFYSHR